MTGSDRAARDRTSGRRLPSVLMLAGVGLIVLGVVWGAWSDPGDWLEEAQAREVIDATVALHAETVSHAEQARGPGPSEAVDGARRRLENASLQVEAARWRSRWAPRTVLATGVVVTLMGAAFGRASA